jgi:Ca2+-binding RTX toxin-like protein
LENLVLAATVGSGTGNSSDNLLVGNSVANTLVGGDGSDTLDGGAGIDSLVGGIGNDYFIIDNVGDRVLESTVSGGTAGGLDTVEARVTGYTLAGGVENLVLFGSVAAGIGNELNNLITGNSASNSLSGGGGNDTLTAAGSNNGIGQRDTLTGSAGADWFVLGNQAGSFYDDGNASNAGAADYAYIADFTVGQDKLVLSGSASDYSFRSSGISALPGTMGIFRGNGSVNDELIAVLKSGNATTLSAADTIQTAQFLGLQS